MGYRHLVVLTVVLQGITPGAAAVEPLEEQFLLRTGGDAPLVTAQQQVAIPSEIHAPRLEFDFAFGTEEALGGEGFFDSATLTLQTGHKSATALLLTVDRLGLNWFPETPGGLLLDPASIEWRTIPFPGISPEPAFTLALHISAAVPPEMSGQPITLFLDLFDNQNASASVAWMSPVTIVPEPSVWALGALAVGLLALRKRFLS
jgi:hypothetical protein